MAVVEINEIDHQEEVDRLKKHEKTQGLTMMKVATFGMDPSNLSAFLYQTRAVKESHEWLTEQMGGGEGASLPTQIFAIIAASLLFVIMLSIGIGAANSPTILIALKLAGDIDANWFVVFIPAFILLGCTPAGTFFGGPYSLFSIATLVLLAYNLEDREDFSYAIVFIPEFIMTSLKILAALSLPLYDIVGARLSAVTAFPSISLIIFYGLLSWKLDTGNDTSWTLILIPAYVWLLSTLGGALSWFLVFRFNGETMIGLIFLGTVFVLMAPFWFVSLLLVNLKLEGADFSDYWIFVPIWSAWILLPLGTLIFPIIDELK